MFKELLGNIVDLTNHLLGRNKYVPEQPREPMYDSVPAPTSQPAPVGSAISSPSKVGMICETIEDLMNNLDLNESIKWSALVVHHSESEDKYGDDFNGIRSYHTKEKQWSEIGYAVLVEKLNGKYVYRIGRPLKMVQAHAQGMNKISPGFCCVGNFDKQEPTQEQWEMMHNLVKAFMIQFNIPAKKVYGHRETYALRGLQPEKSCPGSRWPMDKFRSEL